MSSFQRLGFSAMNWPMSAVASASSISTTSTPRVPQKFELPVEVLVLAHDHAWNAEEDDGSGAQRAGRQRRIQGGSGVRGAAPDVAQAVDFPVRRGIPVLHPAVVPAAELCPALEEAGADGHAALGGTQQGFLKGQRVARAVVLV